MRTLILIVAAGFLTVVSNAQTLTQPVTQKIGYADWEYIFSQMPEAKQIDNELKTHGTQLENQLKAKYQEYEGKLKIYQGLAPTTPDAIKTDKERELAALQENIQKFQTDAQTSLQKKQNDLMQPVFTKVGKAIEDVARENGYSFIINPQLLGGGDILLYSDEKYDISALVLKKMGITPQPAADKTN